MSANEALISWLNDAYALEQNLISVLADHAKDAADHPEIQARLDAHLDETREHAELVERCIERLGGSVSSAKGLVGRVSGVFSGASTALAADELVKNCLADYSMEHFEIASYQSLIAGAEALGFEDVADTCRRILRDEEHMAEWLEENLPVITRNYLVHQEAIA